MKQTNEQLVNQQLAALEAGYSCCFYIATRKPNLEPLQKMLQRLCNDSRALHYNPASQCYCPLTNLFDIKKEELLMQWIDNCMAAIEATETFLIETKQLPHPYE